MSVTKFCLLENSKNIGIQTLCYDTNLAQLHTNFLGHL